ncbi:M56 family metallopeptidase [Clostridium sp. Marseille-P2415]|uniref:M56 family metallopeptidase n=1 Tax=Clostridium sp. Marseille-P2415 TaxID=1805471 RepID=UPI0009885BC5|nr:M56 family metallopeptidase [Clostridium sp. Marseille-P2415]
MYFTIFSITTSIVWVSIFVKSISILRKQMSFLRYFSIYPLILVLYICLIRLFFSIEFPFTKVIVSKKWLPLFQHALMTPIIPLDINYNLTLYEILFILWITVFIYRLYKITIENYRLYRLFQFLPESKDKRLQRILKQVQDYTCTHKKTKIIVNEEVSSPAIIGFFKPTIILPSIDFSDDELLGVLTHEWMHYCYRHVLIKYIGEIIHTFFWWNPIFKELNNEIAHVLEMHSDKKVSTFLNKQQQYSYLNAIIKVVNNIKENRKLSTLTCNLIENSDAEKLKQRFKMLLEGNYSPQKINKNIIIIPFICMLFAFSYMFVLQPYNEPDSFGYGDMIIIPQDAYLIKAGTGYKLYDSNGEFIADISIIDESLKGLKIINNKEDIP